MPRKNEQQQTAQVPRTAADVIAGGWKPGDDFEISFLAIDTRATSTTPPPKRK